MSGRTKGSALIGPVRALRRNRVSALEVLPPELHDYLNSRILVGSWYPVEHYVALLRALSKVARLTWERIGALGARTDLSGGIYSNLARAGRAEDFIALIPVLWRNYHDSGREIVTFSEGRCVIELADFAVVDAEYCKSVSGYNREVIEIAGGVVWAVRKLRCTANGDRSCVWEYDWTAQKREA